MGAVFEVQGTIVGHFSRRQSTVETATYASEFVAARAALDEGLSICYELRWEHRLMGPCGCLGTINQ
jgi:hypothetical protein